MEYIGLLAPIAFVFALSALAQIGAMKKEIDHLKDKLKALEKQQDESSSTHQG